MDCERKLLPCPFCGAKANLVNVRGRWTIECSNKCVGTVIKNDKNVVVEIWNRRTNKDA